MLSVKQCFGEKIGDVDILPLTLSVDKYFLFALLKVKVCSKFLSACSKFASENVKLIPAKVCYHPCRLLMAASVTTSDISEKWEGKFFRPKAIVG